MSWVVVVIPYSMRKSLKRRRSPMLTTPMIAMWSMGTEVRSATVCLIASDSSEPSVSNAVAFRFDPDSVWDVVNVISKFIENVGFDDGCPVGTEVGPDEGRPVGSPEGSPVGQEVGLVGLLDGILVGVLEIGT